MTDYLASTSWIDHHHPSIQSLVADRGWPRQAEIEGAKAAYHFVRDEIAHSWDVQNPTVTRTASEVLEHRVGLCYAKSHLLAALLRAMGTPAGLAYQRLLLGDDPTDGFVAHGLTTVFLAGEWHRLDARGNRPGVDAQFSLTAPKLAFPVRPELGECDYPWNLATPHPQIIGALTQATNILEACLPESLTDPAAHL